MLHRSSRRRAAAVVAAAGALALVAGCGGSDESVTGGGKKDGKVTITVGLYGVMGFKETGLFEKYEKENPNVDVKVEVAGDEQTYYPALQTRLAAGKGLKDIQGIEIGRAKEIVETQADKFVDFSDVKGADHFLPWKQGQITTKDGKVLGLGTDIGPMAVCYRRDYFEKAGLPTDREEVAKLWAGDWKKYVEVGRTFKENFKGGDVAFMDAASGLFNAMVFGYPEQYYNAEGDLIYDTNPAVKEAWNLAADAAEDDLSAKLRQFQPGWDPGLANGTFATAVCPAWMLGHIREKAGEPNKGKWDIAKAPKGANWGGSFLGVVEQSPVKEEAKKLVAWLTAPEQQAHIFQQQGSVPSSQKALELPEVKKVTDEYFNNAPTGQIFGEAAQEIPDNQILGRKDGTIKDTISQGLALVEQGTSRDEAWKTTGERIKKAVR
ncbi:sugar-binding protein [Streptomyces poonensis]|uniref:Sugar-binding protein n=2 Tax=Streptomyces poonensis TaxID=68255 RepID=A0A918UF52_9ACTN|nr:sugar-binding protein [Streptomyces poonensis]GLJ92963.1 sugar-binding protein [Streptomyces poonensis]